MKPILAINEATRLDRPGMVQLDERRLDYVLVTSTVRRRSVPTIFALHEGDDGVDGFAVYKVKHDWPQGYRGPMLDRPRSAGDQRRRRTPTCGGSCSTSI